MAFRIRFVNIAFKKYLLAIIKMSSSISNSQAPSFFITSWTKSFKSFEPKICFSTFRLFTKPSSVLKLNIAFCNASTIRPVNVLCSSLKSMFSKFILISSSSIISKESITFCQASHNTLRFSAETTSLPTSLCSLSTFSYNDSLGTLRSALSLRLRKA